MNRRQERLLEGWLDGPRARHHRRQQALERREFLGDFIAAVIGLAIMFTTLLLLAPFFTP